MKNQKTPKKLSKKTHKVIEQIAKYHSRSHKKFGYLTKEDLYNEIWIICLEKVQDFKPSRGKLEHFLRVAVKTRLINRYKDITKSVKSPCPKCPLFDKSSPGQCAQFGEDKHLCDKWKRYQKSVNSRNALLNATEPPFERSMECGITHNMITREIMEKINVSIEHEYRHDFNTLMTSGSLPKNRMKKLKDNILKVLENDEILEGNV